MTARRVVLEGGAPWGFRMHGGKDHSQLLKISRVSDCLSVVVLLSLVFMLLSFVLINCVSIVDETLALPCFYYSIRSR